MSFAPDLTSRVLRHERLIIAAGIAVLVLLSAAFLLSGAGLDPGGMAAMAPPPLAALILMWWVMMVAMMLPSATPAILLYARVRSARDKAQAIASSWVFLAGYLLVWLGFSLVAGSAQHLLAGGSMIVSDRFATSALLVMAGVYQLSPMKYACLRQCRSPAQFISRNWAPGTRGALRLGVLHGAVCVGCCWSLMALLFVGGIMSFLWIVLLALIVGVEKLVPRGDLLGRAAGIALIAWAALRFAI